MITGAQDFTPDFRLQSADSSSTSLISGSRLTRLGTPIDSAGNSNTAFSIVNHQSSIANQLKYSSTLVQNSERRRIQEAIHPRKSDAG